MPEGKIATRFLELRKKATEVMLELHPNGNCFTLKGGVGTMQVHCEDLNAVESVVSAMEQMKRR